MPDTFQKKRMRLRVNKRLKPTDIVLYCQCYIDDGWYGDRYRVILSKTETEGFNTKTEAKKYSAKLKNYTQRLINRKLSVKENIRTADLGSLEAYTYYSSGPSLYYKHFHISLKDLEEQ